MCIKTMNEMFVWETNENRFATSELKLRLQRVDPKIYRMCRNWFKIDSDFSLYQ
jgi:hypothetical protein